MSNLLYYQWLDLIAQRDRATLFIVVAAMATIGTWLAVRDLPQARRPFVILALVLFYGSLVLVGVQG